MFNDPVMNLAIIYTMVIFGSIVQGSVGFGSCMVVAPVLILIDPNFLPGPLVFLGTSLGLLVALKSFKSVDFSDLKFAIIGRVPGIFLALWVVTVVTHKFLAILLGVMIALSYVGTWLAKFVLEQIPERLFRITFQIMLTALSLRLIWFAVESYS